jgi:hypothetical protein
MLKFATFPCAWAQNVATKIAAKSLRGILHSLRIEITSRAGLRKAFFEKAGKTYAD